MFPHAISLNLLNHYKVIYYSLPDINNSFNYSGNSFNLLLEQSILSKLLGNLVKFW
mgnify:CR=1 FL=1